MLSKYKTEQAGISTEVAIAKLYNVPMNAEYAKRGNDEMTNNIFEALDEYNKNLSNDPFPKPIKHIAEGQNPVDFQLENNKTLSVKSNMHAAGKVAPQIIGQASSITIWDHIPELIPTTANVAEMTYLEAAEIFKQIVFSHIDILLKKYWEYLFDCDYLIFVSNILDKQNNITKPIINIYEKQSSPVFPKNNITFTQTLETWNESVTVKYNKISIGEFQIHRNRNCFKFRFNIAGLIKSGLL